MIEEITNIEQKEEIKKNYKLMKSEIQSFQTLDELLLEKEKVWIDLPLNEEDFQKLKNLYKIPTLIIEELDKDFENVLQLSNFIYFSTNTAIEGEDFYLKVILSKDIIISLNSQIEDLKYEVQNYDEIFKFLLIHCKL